MKRNKLELTWVGKDERPRIEPRVLVEDATLSYRSERTATSDDLVDNRLVFGDNLLALKALEQEFAGKVKCIYIDPPYNTRSAFEHYDDGVEHSIWLSMMRERLELLLQLLAPEGLIIVQADDNEGQYLRVLMDEIFGRRNFVATFIWRKVDSPNDNKVFITPDHEYLTCFARDIDRIQVNRKEDSSTLDAYNQRDEMGRLYRDRLLKKNGKASLRTDRPSMFFPLCAPDGSEVYPIHDDGREARWAMGSATIDELRSRGDLIWKNRGTAAIARWIPYSREYGPDSPQRPYPTIWSDLHTTRQAKAHQKVVLADSVPFDTPKPEPLIQRVLELTTKPGDWVLDSFAGSGTTGAVAHKMGRRWIMIELGEHAHTHIIPRMRKVIDGADAGGITEEANWQGGGGFRYFRLAPSLLEKDSWGNWVISPEYDAAMLSEAVCKLEGFQYAPSAENFWIHGHSTERDFIYVTTQTLTREQLAQIGGLVGAERSLLICCGSFRGRTEDLVNLTVKKIPASLLGKCEFGREDYGLAVTADAAEMTEAAATISAAEEPVSS